MCKYSCQDHGLAPRVVDWVKHRLVNVELRMLRVIPMKLEICVTMNLMDKGFRIVLILKVFILNMLPH